MITTDFEDYKYRFDNKEHFEKWYKEYCLEWCWGNGFGDCSICKENKKLIEGYFDERGKNK